MPNATNDVGMVIYGMILGTLMCGMIINTWRFFEVDDDMIPTTTTKPIDPMPYIQKLDSLAERYKCGIINNTDFIKQSMKLYEQMFQDTINRYAK